MIKIGYKRKIKINISTIEANENFAKTVRDGRNAKTSNIGRTEKNKDKRNDSMNTPSKIKDFGATKTCTSKQLANATAHENAPVLKNVDSDVFRIVDVVEIDSDFGGTRGVEYGFPSLS